MNLQPSVAESPSQRLRIEDPCVAFEERWAAATNASTPAERPAVEAFLNEALPGDRAALLEELLLLEWTYRQKAGEPVQLQEYQAQFPDHAEAVARSWQRWLVLDVGAVPRPTIDHAPPRAEETGGSPDAATADSFATLGPGGGDGGVPSVPGYEILSVLGRGGMGVVYKAWQKSLNRLVALKMILSGSHASAEEIARFRTEAEAIARLRHPGIVQIYEVGEHEGTAFFSLEFCEGGSLDRKLNGTPLPAKEAARLVRWLAEAVQVAHANSVVHRDLKPANVLLAADGTPKVTDFGLAKKLDEQGQTQSGAFMGTPSYAAPEQARGLRVGPAADVYSLGALLYECLTGQPPFRGKTSPETLEMVKAREAPPARQLNAAVPHDLETICLKCLRKEPEKRYASAAELADDLGRFLDGKPILARPVGRVERLIKWARRSPFQAVAAGLSVVAVLGVIVALAGVAWAGYAEAERAKLEAEKSRRIALGSRYVASRYVDAERAVQEDRWPDAEQAAGEALRRLNDEPDLADSGMKEQLRLLHDRARDELDKAVQWKKEQERRAGLERCRDDAFVYGSGLTGLAPAENRRRMLQAVRQGLKLYEIDPDRGDPPALNTRFYAPGEAARVADWCCELLLLEADDLSVPVPDEPKERLLQRLRLALTRIDAAHRVRGAAGPTRNGLTRRATLLEALERPDEADADLDAAGRTPARLGLDELLDGLKLVREGKYEDAERKLSALLREQTSSYPAEYLLALCRLIQNKGVQATRERLSRCLELRPGLPWALLLRGLASLELKQWDEARKDFDAVLKAPLDQETEYVARVNVGALHLKRREWAEAVANLKAAVQLRPGLTPAYLNLALTHRQRADVPPWRHGLLRLAPMGAFAVLAVDAHQRQARGEAVAVLDEAIMNCPPDAGLHHERGQVLLSLGRRVEAYKAFEKAIALALTGKGGTTLADDLVELGRLLYRERRHEEAVRSYQAALGVNKDKAVAWRLMAQPLLALKKYDEAGKALDEFIKTVPVAPGQAPTPQQARTLAEALKVRGLVYDEQTRALWQRGTLHLRALRLRSALDSYNRGLALTPGDPDLLALRGWTYLLCEAPTLALADFDESLKVREGDADALIGRANARARLGQLKEAVKDADQGLEASEADARALYNAARVHAVVTGGLREAGKRNDAERSEQRAAELLGRALEKTREEERPAFWKNYVQADRAFDGVRRGSAMRELAKKYEGGPR